MKMFEAFQNTKELLFNTPFIDVYSVMCNDKEYTVILTRKRANKRTVIYFTDNTIYWEQTPRFPRLAGLHGEKIPICKFDTANTSNTLFVVRGTPMGDEGVDNGIFRSMKRYDETFVNCMTYKQFKML